MDLALVSVMADTAAAFGVIGSLMFVGFQVRQNSAGLHNAAVQSLMATYQDMFSNVIDSGEVTELMLQGLKDPGKLEDTSLMRFYAIGSKFLRTYQGMHWQWQQGAIDDGLFMSMTTMIEDIGINPGWQQMWSARRHQYDGDFQEFMDKMIASDKGVAMWPGLISEDAENDG